MRLFIGVRPSEEFQTALSALQDRLRAAGVTGRFLEPANLHMTLAFIGEWPEDVTEFLPEVKKPFEIALSHIGVFTDADVLWAGIAPCEALDVLARRIRHILADAAIPFDRKAFSPHFTLARKPSVPKYVTLSEIEVPHAVMTVDTVSLFRSDHVKSGMVYTVIGQSPCGDD